MPRSHPGDEASILDLTKENKGNLPTGLAGTGPLEAKPEPADTCEQINEPVMHDVKRLRPRQKEREPQDEAP